MQLLSILDIVQVQLCWVWVHGFVEFKQWRRIVKDPSGPPYRPTNVTVEQSYIVVVEKKSCSDSFINPK